MPGVPEAALNGKAVDERLLHRVQNAVLCKAFDRHDVVALGLNGKVCA